MCKLTGLWSVYQERKCKAKKKYIKVWVSYGIKYICEELNSTDDYMLNWV